MMRFLTLDQIRRSKVHFGMPVSIAEHPKINEWLTLVEKEMRFTLAKYLASAVTDMTSFKHGKIEAAPFLKWMDKYQVQIVVLAAQIFWSEEVEGALQKMAGQKSVDMTQLEGVLQTVESTLRVLADSVLQEQPPVRRKKLEHLVSSFDCSSAVCISLEAL